jgi:hypothetical protein
MSGNKDFLWGVAMGALLAYFVIPFLLGVVRGFAAPPSGKRRKA